MKYESNDPNFMADGQSLQDTPKYQKFDCMFSSICEKSCAHTPMVPVNFIDAKLKQ